MPTQPAVETPSQAIRFSCPVTLLSMNVSPMLAEFMTLHPALTLEVEATNRRVDPAENGMDFVLRVRSASLLEEEGVVVRVLSVRRIGLVASPLLLSRHPPVREVQELALLPSLEWGVPAQSHAWELRGPNDEDVRVEHVPRLITRDLTTLLDAAMAGVGVVRLPRMVTREMERQGRLRQVLPNWSLQEQILHVAFPIDHGLSPAARELVEFLSQRFQTLDEE